VTGRIEHDDVAVLAKWLLVCDSRAEVDELRFGLIQIVDE
jgi:hypothetical protein